MGRCDRDFSKRGRNSSCLSRNQEKCDRRRCSDLDIVGIISTPPNGTVASAPKIIVVAPPAKPPIAVATTVTAVVLAVIKKNVTEEDAAMQVEKEEEDINLEDQHTTKRNSRICA
jgi:hypothetical protein